MNILVISSNLIGDSILSTGIIKYFVDKYPGSKITIVVGPSAAQIYKNFPNLEKILIIKKLKFNLHWFTIWKKCILIKWDVIIDFRSSKISHILLHKKSFIFRSSNNKHKIEQLSDFFKLDKIAYPIIFNSFIETQVAEEKLIQGKKYIVVAPGGNWQPKIWPAINFNKLLKALLNMHKKDLYVILVGTLLEKEKYKKEIIENLDEEKVIDLMGETVTQTYAFMKKSTLFVGNDSGLMHLAATSNILTIGLFGPTNDKIYSPFGDNCYSIRTKETYDDFKLMKIEKNKSYMESLKVEEIIELINNKRLI